MRKNFKRLMTAALALTMSVSMLAMSAAAAEHKVGGIVKITEDINAKLSGGNVAIYDWDESAHKYIPAVLDGGYKVTDKKGVYLDANKLLNSLNPPEGVAGRHVYKDEYKMLDFGGSDTWDFIGMGIAGDDKANNGVYKMPVSSIDAAGGIDKWNEKYGENGSNIVLMFAPHVHRIPAGAPWYGDRNNHWKICPQCNEFAWMNWHHDVDNNGICDQCGLEIVYRNVTVKDSEGGTVTPSVTKGMLGNRVSVTVTPDAGYKLAELRAQNDNGKSYSIRPCFKDIEGKEYHFFLDVWDVELNAKFVKE